VLWDISFQLSFGAVLGLSLFGTPFAQAWNGMLTRLFPPSLARILNGFTGEAIPISLAAQVFTLPLIVLYFQRFSLVALIVNVLVLPLQPLILYLGLSGALLAWLIPPLAQAILWLVFVLLMATIGVVRAGSRLPFADVPLYIDPRILALVIGLIGGGALVQAVRPDVMKRLATFVRGRPAWMTVVISGVCVAMLLWAIGLSRADGKLHLWFLAQGHSHAILIQTPNGAKILVDGGHYPSRLLTALGDHLPFYDRRLDALIVTQPDPFDMGALPAVLERYTVGTAITNGQPQQDEALLTMIDALAQTPIIEATAGYQFTTSDGVTIDILHPSQRPNLGDSLDENGLVLRVSYGTMSFLLPGDATIETLMQVGETSDLTSTVLSLPQHGTVRSLTSEFLALVQPSAVILQSDPANRRGDPDEAVLRLVEERGVPLLRTDLRGTIHFYTDGTRLWSTEE
jgi:competence protein ComEC